VVVVVGILVTGTIDIVIFVFVYAYAKYVDALGPLTVDDVAILVMGSVEVTSSVVIDGVWVMIGGLVTIFIGFVVVVVGTVLTCTVDVPSVVGIDWGWVVI